MASSFTDSDQADPTECFMRILSGPHLGVCVPLSQGDYLIGRGYGSDFVIADDAIADRHATLKVMQGNVNLLAENGGEATYLDGKPVTGEKFPLVPGRVFTLGKTHFALTEKGTEDAAKIELPVIEWQDEEEPIEEGESESDSEDADSAGGELADLNPISETVTASDFARGRRQSGGKGGCIFASILILVMGALGIYFGEALWSPFFGSEDPSTEMVEKISPEQAIATLLANYPDEKGLSIEKNEATGAVTVDGLVSSSEMKSTLMREIRLVAPAARIKMSSVEVVESAIRSVLRQLDAGDLTAAFSTDATLKLGGQLPEGKDLTGLIGQIERDFPMIGKVDSSNVWSRENLVEKLSVATANAGLDEYLSFALEDTRLLVGGTLPPEKAEPFQQLKTNLKSEFEPTLTLVDQVEILKKLPSSTRVVTENPDDPLAEPGPNPDSGPAEVPLQEKAGIAGFRNVTVGAISWVVTSDGQKLLEGATLPSGFSVEKITRDYVQLRKENIIETIYLK